MGKTVVADSKKISVTVTLSSPASVSPVFTPVINTPFYVQIGGTYVGATHYVTQSVAGSSQSLARNPDGVTPLSLYSPGATLINPPYTKPGATAPTYTVVLKTLVSGSVTYTMYQ
jgi:hypothetical protein